MQLDIQSQDVEILACVCVLGECAHAGVQVYMSVHAHPGSQRTTLAAIPQVSFTCWGWGVSLGGTFLVAWAV